MTVLALYFDGEVVLEVLGGAGVGEALRADVPEALDVEALVLVLGDVLEEHVGVEALVEFLVKDPGPWGREPMERQVLAVPGVYLSRTSQFLVSDATCPVDLGVEMVAFRLEGHRGDVYARLSEPVADGLLHGYVASLPDLGVADDAGGIYEVLGGPRR